MTKTELDSILTESQRLFPLPLTTFESFMLVDDRPEYPMTFIVRLEFDGRVDREKFSQALDLALARSPLLTARVAEEPGRKPSWIWGETTPVLDFSADAAPIADRCTRHIDLRREPGLRTWVRTFDDKSRVTFQFHHACCDGVGSSHFVEDLLVAYATKYDGSGPEMRPLDMARLARRGDLDIPRRSFLERLYDTWMIVRESCKLMVIGTQPLAAVKAADCEEPPATDGEEFLEHMLPPDIAKRLRATTRRRRVSLNDLLLRDLFLVLRDWNREHGIAGGRKPLRINMPVNLRSRADRAMPAANLMSFAFVSRRQSACDAPDELLEDIRKETRATIQDRFSLYFLGMIDAANSLRILARFLRRDHCFASVVLTNMGDATRRFVAQLPRRAGLIVAGNLTLTNCSGSPPMRQQTRAVFSLGSYGQHLTLCLRCDPRGFSPEDSRRLLEMYAARLTESAE